MHFLLTRMSNRRIVMCAFAAGLLAISAVRTLAQSPSTLKLTDHQVIQLCKNAYAPDDTNLPVNWSDSRVIRHDHSLTKNAWRELHLWLRKPGNLAVLQRIAKHSKVQQHTYAATAYVLGYLGTDVPNCIHKLRQINVTINEAMAAPDAIVELYERHPSSAALREVLLFQGDAATEEEMDDSFRGLFMRHHCAIFSACANDPGIKSNVASLIVGCLEVEPVNPPDPLRHLVEKIASSNDEGQSRVARYVIRYCQNLDKQNKTNDSSMQAFPRHHDVG